MGKDYSAYEAELDRYLAELAGEAPPKKKRRRRLALRIPAVLLRVTLLVVLPFWALIGVATLTYKLVQWPTWSAVALGVLSATMVLTAYGAYVSKRFTGKLRLRAVGTRVVLPVVVIFTGYTLVYLSSANVKSEELRDYYRSVHPLLRVASSTIILFDREVVVTDLGRTPEDYIGMGLSPRESSWHYVQDDGYVHAMDLRTLGRPKWRNFMLKLYFDFMGFRTLRHVGTADHLHVSLPTNR